MPKVFEGKLDDVKGRFAIVVSRYNESVTGKLLNARNRNAHKERNCRRRYSCCVGAGCV